jgi:hypothetical protein
MGKLRDDFAHQDVSLIFMADAGVVIATRYAAPDAWRRLVGYLLQAFAAKTARPLPDPPTATRCTEHSCACRHRSSAPP